VRPRVTVQPADRVVSFDQLKLPYPAVLSGAITDPNGAPVANADVDAWFAVRDPMAKNGLAGTVVQIAETTTDDQGRYTLILPASIAP
jgi:protocatechuate 3,4-dioxygenase beta subunit